MHLEESSCLTPELPQRNCKLLTFHWDQPASFRTSLKGLFPSVLTQFWGDALC
jgi:hypothetical protein